MFRFVPLNHERHRELTYLPVTDYRFAREISQIDLIQTEIWPLASHFPIVFTNTTADTLNPVAIIGRPRQPNRLIGRNGEWLNPVIPSLLRIYPFALETQQNQTMRVLIDEGARSFQSPGGTRLFAQDGLHTQALTDLLALFQSVHTGLTQAQTLGRIARKLNLLSSPEELGLIDTVEEQYLVVDSQKLETLSASQLILLRRQHMLPLLYAMSFSVEFDLNSQSPLFWTLTAD